MCREKKQSVFNQYTYLEYLGQAALRLCETKALESYKRLSLLFEDILVVLFTKYQESREQTT